jgi:hypothetical protein
MNKQIIIISNKTGKVYSLEYTKIPKVFSTGDDVSRETKVITNATMVSKATNYSRSL